MAVVYLALGTNLGDRVANLRDAVARLAPNVRVTATSSIYETEPWGIKEQPRFLNMVLRAETDLEPGELLRFLKDIEHAMGRTAGVRFGPRLIDLDILFYDDRIVSSEGRRFNEASLQIPHPRIAERRFVLVPLAEIAPDLIHPALGIPIRELLARLPDDGGISPYGHLNQ